jgi:hypothetical protein
MYPAPQRCPTCNHSLELRELACPACATVVRGQWAPGPFSRLSPDQQTFLTLFVRARGNLSDVERTLGVSYPTVRAKLDEIIAALDQPPAAETAGSPPGTVGQRRAILEQIARGELSAAEGMARLRQLS